MKLQHLSLLLFIGIFPLPVAASEIKLKCQMYRQSDKSAIDPFLASLNTNTNFGSVTQKGETEEVAVAWSGSKATFGTKKGGERMSILDYNTVDINTGKITGAVVVKLDWKETRYNSYGTCNRMK